MCDCSMLTAEDVQQGDSIRWLRPKGGWAIATFVRWDRKGRVVLIDVNGIERHVAPDVCRPVNDQRMIELRGWLGTPPGTSTPRRRA